MSRLAAAVMLLLLVAGCGSASRQAGHSEPTPADCQPLSGGETKSEPAVGGLSSDLGAGRSRGRASDRVRVPVPHGITRASRPASISCTSRPPLHKTEDGSGRTIEVDGTAFLVIQLSNAATADILGDKVTPTYTGPRRVTAAGTRFIREVVKTGDFENTVTWVIGLDEKRPYTGDVLGHADRRRRRRLLEHSQRRRVPSAPWNASSAAGHCSDSRASLPRCSAPTLSREAG